MLFKTLNRYVLFVTLLFIAIIALQYDLWWSSSGVFAVKALASRVMLKAQENKKLEQRNSAMYAEIVALRAHGRNQVLEGMARANLGLIKQGEIFYQIISPSH